MVAEQPCSCCGVSIADRDTPFLLDERVVCVDCHDKARPTCPYCRTLLPKRPPSKKPCPSCGETIIVRAGQTYFGSTLLTLQQLKELDKLKGWGCARTAMVRDGLKAELGRDPKPNEIIDAARIDQLRRSPASDRQMQYVADLGLVLPEPTAWHATRLLTAFQEMRFQVSCELTATLARDPTDQEVSCIVMALADDPEFQRLARRNELWGDMRWTAKAESRMRQVVRRR